MTSLEHIREYYGVQDLRSKPLYKQAFDLLTRLNLHGQPCTDAIRIKSQRHTKARSNDRRSISGTLRPPRPPGDRWRPRSSCRVYLGTRLSTNDAGSIRAAHRGPASAGTLGNGTDRTSPVFVPFCLGNQRTEAALLKRGENERSQSQQRQAATSDTRMPELRIFRPPPRPMCAARRTHGCITHLRGLDVSPGMPRLRLLASRSVPGRMLVARAGFVFGLRPEKERT